MSGKKYISTFLTPWPSQDSHRPPLTLNENRPAEYPRTRASFAFAKISLTKEDFPPPETPVTQINLPKGNLTSMFFKLCSLAPIISRYLVLGIEYLVSDDFFCPILNT